MVVHPCHAVAHRRVPLSVVRPHVPGRAVRFVRFASALRVGAAYPADAADPAEAGRAPPRVGSAGPPVSASTGRMDCVFCAIVAGTAPPGSPAGRVRHRRSV
ncbi:hypothetical protein GCM10009760_47860 [Kitasatospora kazusensis]|uniref:Uncharacterized protein n=1 Tax=Kitasatospora kazusensis TaxID=407974 RepID=A0ABN3A1E8_9ACTN